MPKKKDVVKEVPVVPVEPVEPDVACPVCGKPVSMDVNTCPHCGAEFEEEAEEVVEAEAVPAKAAAVEEEETAECPVCGKSVSLNVSSCPYCGAEFEEDEVEEVIEVEEKEVAVTTAEEEYVEEETTTEETIEEEPVPASITDFRVIGVALILLGIIGLQIALMIDWYWSWVPPIKSHLGMFIAIPVIVIVVGLLLFLIIKKMSSEGRTYPTMMPGFLLSLFLFGIMILILVMLWSPINNALQDSQIGVGGAFLAILVVGVLVMFMGQKMAVKDEEDRQNLPANPS
jgi:predicted nucleic acid-binding Zn ribbon protein